MECLVAAPTELAATMAAQSGLEPFRLMDLPTELRLMIYKRLPRQIKHTELRYDDRLEVDSVILVTRHLPTALLRASREIYAEAHDIVAALIRTFVKESQPKIFEHNSCDGLLDVVNVISTERAALSAGQSCLMIAVSQRNLKFAHHPWITQRPREVIRFLCQVTLATSNTISIVSCPDFDKIADHYALVQGVRIRKFIADLRIQSWSRSGLYGQLDENCMDLHTPRGEMKLTATNTPAKVDKCRICGIECFNDVWTIHISQETWYEEWLPSV
ncbi:unnamed protein product [Alternaria alternata]